jgi:hypothetical protein
VRRAYAGGAGGGGAGRSGGAALTSEEARQRAQAEELTLLVAENTAGYFGVALTAGQMKPYAAHVKRGGKKVHLGMFATAEEAALCRATTCVATTRRPAK